jgi:hypothetical protein
MLAVSRVLKSFAASESGATAIEYGLICSLIVTKSYVGLWYRKIYEILQSKSYVGLWYHKFYEILR